MWSVFSVLFVCMIYMWIFWYVVGIKWHLLWSWSYQRTALKYGYLQEQSLISPNDVYAFCFLPKYIIVLSSDWSAVWTTRDYCSDLTFISWRTVLAISSCCISEASFLKLILVVPSISNLCFLLHWVFFIKWRPSSLFKIELHFLMILYVSKWGCV